MPRYIGHFNQRKRNGEADDRPDLRDLGKKLLGYLEQQRKLSGTKTLSIQREASDGSVVRAYFIGDTPCVDILPAPAKPDVPHKVNDVILRCFGVSSTDNKLYQFDLERYLEVKTLQANGPPSINVLLKKKLFTATPVATGFDRVRFLTPEYPANWYKPFDDKRLNQNLLFSYVGFSSVFPYEVRRLSLTTYLVEASWAAPLAGFGAYQEIHTLAFNKLTGHAYVSVGGLDEYDEVTNIGTANGRVLLLDGTTLAEGVTLRTTTSGPNTIPIVSGIVRTDPVAAQAFVGIYENDAVTVWRDRLFIYDSQTNIEIEEITPTDTHYDYVQHDIRMTELGGVINSDGTFDYVWDTTLTGYRLTKYSRKMVDGALVRENVAQATFVSATIGHNSFSPDYTRLNVTSDPMVMVSPNGKLLVVPGAQVTSGSNNRLAIAIHDAETLQLKITRTLGVAADPTVKYLIGFSLDNKRIFTTRQTQTGPASLVISVYDIAKDQYTDVLTVDGIRMTGAVATWSQQGTGGLLPVVVKAP